MVTTKVSPLLFFTFETESASKPQIGEFVLTAG